MADVCANDSWTRQTHLRIHVGAVHVNLPPGLVNHVNDLDDLSLEHTEGARVRHHERRDIVPVLLHLRAQVVKVDVPLVVVVHHHDLHPRHARRCGVGPVGRLGDQADVAVSLPDRFEVVLDGEEAGVLARGARVGLRRHRREACDLRQIFVEIFDQLVIPLHLIVRGEGVDVGKRGPRDRDHFGGSIELHGARSQRDHGVVQGQVAIFQRFEVAKHLRLGVVLPEDGVGQNF
mmetsp:Transcript_12825/g.27711  ORF Transcript_12825/g.27711 Transcript_12825/m.27711 type:complete len:233 (-) Transcript_12825:1659-2357(-)